LNRRTKEQVADMPDNSSTTVTIVNNSRRPVAIRCPGHTVRLAAGEKADVLRSWLKTSELRALCDAGIASVLEPPPPSPAGAKRTRAAPPRRDSRRRKSPERDSRTADTAESPESGPEADTPGTSLDAPRTRTDDDEKPE
jgi:hypothetical protein